MADAGRPGPVGSLLLVARRARVADAYLRGEFQHVIAEKEGVNQATISRDLDAVRQAWLEAAVRDIDAHKGHELARLDTLERAYWQAWERSCQERQTSSTKKATGKKDGEKLEAAMKKEQRDGDPRFLEGVLSCICARCKVLGLAGDGSRGDVTILLARLADLEALANELSHPTIDGTLRPARTALLGDQAATDGGAPEAEAAGSDADGEGADDGRRDAAG